jgi:S-adenosylmethionine hydrolase
MAHPLITLTTDFGTASPYVAAMKGVILTINPTARLVDLSHDIPPQDLLHTALFLAAALPYFPPNTLHVVVVDPGVGSSRAILYVEAASQSLLVPDNGCWTLLGEPRRVLFLTQTRFWRPVVSATFHGRDIIAPVAAHLSLGVDPTELGVPAESWQRLAIPPPVIAPGSIRGEVVFIDSFGNLITNIESGSLPSSANRSVRIQVGEQEVTRRVRTYSEAERGTLVGLVSSGGQFEIAVVQGSAARELGAMVGTSICIEWSSSQEAIANPS